MCGPESPLRGDARTSTLFDTPAVERRARPRGSLGRSPSILLAHKFASSRGLVITKWGEWRTCSAVSDNGGEDPRGGVGPRDLEDLGRIEGRPEGGVRKVV